jgi:uncharacterized damage-inducible protein DinB
MHYHIRVKGHLDFSWQDRFEGWHIELQEAGATLLSGSFPDQAALHGMLLQIIRLGLTLLSLEMSEASRDESAVPLQPLGCCSEFKRSKEYRYMTEHTLPLITFYQGWETYQQSLVETIAPLSPEQLALPVAPHHWTIGMVAQHMVANRVWWFQGWMGEGNPELAPIAHWDPADEVEHPMLKADELVAGLESTWGMIAQALESFTPSDMEHVFSPPAFLSEAEKRIFGERTLQWIFWHVHEHEIHHGGELSLALGGYGLPGIYGSM